MKPQHANRLAETRCTICTRKQSGDKNGVMASGLPVVPRKWHESKSVTKMCALHPTSSHCSGSWLFMLSLQCHVPATASKLMAKVFSQWQQSLSVLPAHF